MLCKYVCRSRLEDIGDRLIDLYKFLLVLLCMMISRESVNNQCCIKPDRSYKKEGGRM